MKNSIIQKICIAILVIAGSLQFAYSQTTNTVNYTIPDWNTSGSFTFETGTAENPVTNKVEGYIKVTNGDDVIVEINSQKIESMIQQIELGASVKTDEADNFITITDRKNEMLNKLKLLKAILGDGDKMKKLIMDMDGINSLNWDYTVSTIRGIETEVTGIVD